MTTSNTALSQKTLNKVFWRWYFWGQIGWNYEKMQGSGYCYAMMPALKEIYTNEDDLQTAVKNHLQFFNTTPDTAFIILGIDCAVEPELGVDGLEAVNGIKTGLMGPFAGVGDSIFGVVIPTIFGAIAAYMALDGNPVGCFIWIAMGRRDNHHPMVPLQARLHAGPVCRGHDRREHEARHRRRLHPGPRRRWRPRVLRRLHPRARHLHLR